MAQTKSTTFTLYVDGNIRPTGEEGHRTYVLGYSTQYENPELAYQEVYSDLDMSNFHQFEDVQNDFITVISMRIQVSTTITHDVPAHVDVTV